MGHDIITVLIVIAVTVFLWLVNNEVNKTPSKGLIGYTVLFIGFLFLIAPIVHLIDNGLSSARSSG